MILYCQTTDSAGWRVGHWEMIMMMRLPNKEIKLVLAVQIWNAYVADNEMMGSYKMSGPRDF